MPPCVHLKKKTPGHPNRSFDSCQLRAEDAIKHVWLGAAQFASQPELLKEVLVSKAEYDEKGSTWLARRFAGER